MSQPTQSLDGALEHDIGDKTCCQVEVSKQLVHPRRLAFSWCVHGWQKWQNIQAHSNSVFIRMFTPQLLFGWLGTGTVLEPLLVAGHPHFWALVPAIGAGALVALYA